MDGKKKKRSPKIIVSAVILSFALSGCKRIPWLMPAYSDYDCVRVCESPHIELPSDASLGLPIILDIEGVDQTREIIAVSDSGQINLTIGYNAGKHVVSEEGMIWEVDTRIKGDKLYMTVEKDYVSDHEGEEFVLEKRDLDEVQNSEK